MSSHLDVTVTTNTNWRLLAKLYRNELIFFFFRCEDFELKLDHEKKKEKWGNNFKLSCFKKCFPHITENVSPLPVPPVRPQFSYISGLRHLCGPATQEQQPLRMWAASFGYEWLKLITEKSSEARAVGWELGATSSKPHLQDVHSSLLYLSGLV